MDTADEELSKRLHEVLDVIGASEYYRKKLWELAMINEISYTIASQFYDKTSNKRSFYHVGSSCEGTTSPGLDADVDMIKCDEDCLVVDKLVDEKQQGKSYFFLIDDDTQPGYVRLALVMENCQPLVGMCDVSEYSRLTIDGKGILCKTHSTLIGNLPSTRNGPADTFTTEYVFRQMDLVYALRCQQIPRSANSWLHRTRKYDWPSQKQLKTMGSYGCFFVGVGHPHSNFKSVEWRISFSLQERFLMSSLNETQHKCFILLKMIKKNIIEARIGESISSYHCKTSLFYTIETSHSQWWTENKLIMCVRLCLIRLLSWVKAKNCPNYFIAEENMFDKLNQRTLENVEHVLNDIINSGVKFLYSLTCDNVGKLLKSKTSVSELACSLGNMSTIKVYHDNAYLVYSVRNYFFLLLYESSNPNTDFMNETTQLLSFLHKKNNVTEHTTKDVRMTIASIIPHIQIQYQQCLFAQYLSMRSFTIPRVISETSDCDLISSKLYLASFYIQSEQNQEECERILVSCENSLEPYVISVCPCKSERFYNNQALYEKLKFTDMSNKDFRRNCTTGCMIFNPYQVSLVHKALQYEMFRNAYTLSGSEYDRVLNHWLDWISVDSQMYLYFLQYLLFSKTKKVVEINIAAWKLLDVLETDHNLGHRETGLNLFGWIYLQEKKLPTAWTYFCRSWKHKPFKNAAKWHMLIVLREQIKGKQN